MSIDQIYEAIRALLQSLLERRHRLHAMLSRSRLVLLEFVFAAPSLAAACANGTPQSASPNTPHGSEAAAQPASNHDEDAPPPPPTSGPLPEDPTCRVKVEALCFSSFDEACTALKCFDDCIRQPWPPEARCGRGQDDPGDSVSETYDSSPMKKRKRETLHWASDRCVASWLRSTSWSPSSTDE